MREHIGKKMMIEGEKSDVKSAKKRKQRPLYI